MTTLIATLILSGLIGLFFGYMIWSPDPVKRTIADMNENEALRAEIRRLKGEDAPAKSYIDGLWRVER
jgi:hypothetical protein